MIEQALCERVQCIQQCCRARPWCLWGLARRRPHVTRSAGGMTATLLWPACSLREPMLSKPGCGCNRDQLEIPCHRVHAVYRLVGEGDARVVTKSGGGPDNDSALQISTGIRTNASYAPAFSCMCTWHRWPWAWGLGGCPLIVVQSRMPILRLLGHASLGFLPAIWCVFVYSYIHWVLHTAHSYTSRGSSLVGHASHHNQAVACWQHMRVGERHRRLVKTRLVLWS